MSDDDSLVGQSVFGLFDGLTSLLGLLAGLIVAHATSVAILDASVGIAIAEGVGMAFGDWLSGSSRKESTVIGAATFVGALLPAIPVALIPGPVGYWVGAALVVGIAVGIAEARARHGRLKAYLTTAVTLIVAAGLSVGASLLLGAA